MTKEGSQEYDANFQGLTGFKDLFLLICVFCKRIQVKSSLRSRNIHIIVVCTKSAYSNQYLL